MNKNVDTEFTDIAKESKSKNYIIVIFLYIIVIILLVLLVLGLKKQKEIVENNMNAQIGSQIEDNI